MSGKGRGWSDSAPLLGQQQQQSQSQSHQQQQQQQHKLREFQHRSSSSSSSNYHSSLSLEMTYSAVPTARSVVLGIGVGTGSARAGLFNENGKLLGFFSSSIQIWIDGDCVEQSSTDIWHAVSAAVKAVCSLAKSSKEEVKGMGFVATCSRVAVDADGSPVYGFLEW